MLFHGAIVHSISLTELAYLPSALISVSALGLIDWVEDVSGEADLDATLSRRGATCQASEVVTLKKGQFLSPGLIDTHTHAPQHPNIGLGGQYQLLDWLDKVTFPEEARYSDVSYAKKIYKKVVERTLALGTTTSCYYGSLHLESTCALADLVHEAGQRALVGKCNMDRNCPSHYIEESPESSLRDTKALISHIDALHASSSASSSSLPALVEPIVTPRFAISCSAPLLASLGQLVATESSTRPLPLAVQTHMSENLAEIAFAYDLFSSPKARSSMSSEREWDGTYASTYDGFGLLGPRTILAHCVHLQEQELQTIKRTGTGVSHCPTSNFNLRSGCARVGELLDRGIKVGLGTDCSGGFEMGILSQIRAASTCSKMVPLLSSSPQCTSALSSESSSSEDEGFANAPQLPLPVLFHMATLGGASLCGLDDRIGNFVMGKEFDALLVDLSEDRGNGNLWWSEVDSGEDWLEAAFQQWVFSGDDRNIAKVFVRGRLVAGQDGRHRTPPA